MSYSHSLIILSEEIKKFGTLKGSYISMVYSFYFKTILPYLFALVKTEEIQSNLEKHILNIHIITCKQLRKIISLFISQLEGYLKKN